MAVARKQMAEPQYMGLSVTLKGKEVTRSWEARLSTGTYA